MTQHSLVALALAAALASGAASAGPLAPTRASDLVTVVNDNFANCPVSGVAFDERVLADGSKEPFAIPAKHVFVVTGLDFIVQGLGGAGTGTVALTQQSGATSTLLLQGAGVIDAGGTFAGSAAALPGIAVRSGTLCLLGGTPPSGILRGFFAKDK